MSESVILKFDLFARWLSLHNFWLFNGCGCFFSRWTETRRITFIGSAKRAVPDWAIKALLITALARRIGPIYGEFKTMAFLRALIPTGGRVRLAESTRALGPMTESNYT